MSDTKIRMIALDLDNTTLYDANTISEGNREALGDAAAEGCEVVVASGRVFSSLPECILRIPDIRYVITSNGAAIYKLPEKREKAEEIIAGAKRIRRLGIPPEKTEAIMNLLDEFPSSEYPISFETFINGRAYGYADYVRRPERYGLSPAYVEYVRSTRIMIEDIRSFIREHAEELDGIDLQVGRVSVPDPDHKEEEIGLVDLLRRKLHEEVPGIYITASVPNRIEMSNAEAGKASGIRYLMNILGIKRKETASFGDADNDIDMLQAAGTGIAMRNGTSACRKAADYVTKSCRDDGVAWAIHGRLGFRNRRAEKEKFMRAAITEARKAEQLNEVPIGCVIVREGKIIARGYNRRNTDGDTLSHAEMNAIHRACRRLGDWRLDGCTMYVTLEPCPMCAGAIVQSRIDKVVIGCRSIRTGCAGSVLDLMHVPSFGHNVETETGILGTECQDMLQDFFTRLRVSKNGSV